MNGKKVEVLANMISHLTKTATSMIYYVIHPEWQEDPVNGFRVVRQIVDKAEEDLKALQEQETK